MKKIYILTAVLVALLTLSLNAQLKATKNGLVVQPKVPTEKVHISFDGHFNTGPTRDGEVTPPYTCGFSNSELTGWLIIDNNNDETSWGIYQDQAIYEYSSVNNADDWLVSPGVILEAGKTYIFSLDTKAESSGYPERLEVRMSNDMNSLPGGTSIIPSTQVSNTSYTTLSNQSVTVSTTGVYYFGIHAISNADMYVLWVDNVSITVPAETADETICDGTDTNEFLPIYGYYCDDFQINQMIYPESMLTNLVGGTITSMTFYANAAISANLAGNGRWTIKLGTTNQTAFASSLNNITRLVPNNITTVVQNYTLPTGNNTLTITFDTPFTYTGGNLLVDFQETTESGYSHTYFYGTNQSNYTGFNSYYGTNSPNSNGIYTNGRVHQFLPKVTFSYEVPSEPEHDLAIALSAPTTAGAGSTVTLTATVTNNGDFDENGYTVTFTANGTTIDTQTGGALAQGASATFTTTYTTDANAGTVNFGASVACTDDADASNNTATASTTLIVMPPPENVAATGGEDSGTMTWDPPTIPTTAITEGFDDTSEFTPFSIGGITATQHTGTIGGWTVYTPSTNSVYAYSGATFDNAYQPQAWTVFNTSLSGSYDTHSGNQVMLSFCDAGTGNGQGILTTDHWLISPELSGEAQTITFWERVITAQYGPETFEVLASSTDNNPASFTSVQSFSSTSTGWLQHTATLPPGTKYFAIRHTSYDIFGLLIDDVTYVPAPIEPVSYNIYLEGQLVGNVNANTFSYTFNNLSDGTYQCSVSAVYDGGYESAAVPTTFTIITKNPTIEITPATQTINDAAAGSLTVTGTDIDGNINVSAANDWYLNPNSLSNTGGNVSVSYTGRELSATTTVTATDANDNTVSASATVNYVANVYIVGDYGSGWDFNNGTQMTNSNGTYTATITVNANTYILFARLLGNNNPWGSRDVFGPDSNGNWWMQGNSASGDLDLNASNCIYFPDGGTYRITINANDGTFTITKLYGEQTEPPVITSTSDGEYVTITATGAGTVTLNVPGHEPVSGEGEVSITVPCGYASNTINVSATAQESGKDESDPATAQVTIPAGSGWIVMDGEYNNPNDLLSFTKDGEEIALIDQFLESTKNNDHPDHYTYTFRQTVNGEEKTSTPVSIPVYKTNSSIRGLYTQTQVENDTLMQLKANVLNTEMDYDVHPDRNTLYYSLYRSEMDQPYPLIKVDTRISQLQRFYEMVGDYPQYFLFESHQDGVAPRYDRIGSQVVERLDTNWVEGTVDSYLNYVPVVWTYWLYTARGDSINNSYGSDIKREVLGGVTAEIQGTKSDYKDWGEWEVNGTTYCVYTPVIRITGSTPLTVTSGDGDVNTYVPYMYRAWCTYEGARDFKHNSDGQLIDNGPMTTPILLGTDRTDNHASIIGGDWNPGDGRLDWAFGVPVDEDSTNVTFVIRFYYKKVVTEAQQGDQNNMLRLGNGESEEYFIVETEGDATSIVTAINELYNSRVPVSVTYVNAQGMQSSKPFDGINIVVTRYSDGTTRTTKVIR